MSLPIPQATFTSGELTHRMAGAITLDQYGLAVTKARNFHILPQGPMRKRSGYYFITPTKFQPGSGKETTAWIDFIFNKNQTYAIEAGDKYFRFYANGGRVMNGSVPYEIATPYAAADVRDLKFIQISDIMYIVHQNYPVQKLRRAAETNWTLTPVTYIDGPYADINKTDTVISWTNTFKPAGVGVHANAWDSDNNTKFEQGVTTYDFTYTFSGTNEFAVNGYMIYFRGNMEDGAFTKSQADCPRAWIFQGQKAGSTTWVTLDQRSSEADWLPGQSRVYEFANINEVKYHVYKLSVTETNGSDGLDVWEISLKMMNISGGFSFSSVNGINSGQGFKSTDVGRNVRFQGADGYWRYVKITSVTNSTTIVGNFYGLWFHEVSNTTKWRLAAFSPTSGYPGAISLFEERLALAGSVEQPRTIWLTKTGDFEGYTPDNVLNDSSAITVTLTGESLDVIKWLSAGKGLFAGTAGGVTSISGGNDPLTYKNVRQVSQTNYGASSNRPIRVGPALLFQAVFSNCMRELLYNFNDDAYDAPDITYLNEHIYRRMLASVWLESPDEQALTPMVSGAMGVLTYVRAQKVYGSTAYETDGQFLTACSIPNMNKKRSDHYVTTLRTINGVQKQYVEYAADPFEYQDMDESCFLDCALSYVGAPATVFSGLGHLEGKTVTVCGYLNNEDAPKVYTRVVTGGQVTMASPLNNVVVGLPFTGQLEILRSRSNRPDSATSFGSRQRIDNILLDLYRTANLTINTPNFQKKDQVDLRSSNTAMDEGTLLFTGHKIVNIEGSWQDGGVLSVWSESPYPAMVRLIMPTKDQEP